MKTRSIIGTVLAAIVIFQSCTKEETSSPRVTLIEKIVTDVPSDTIIGFSPIITNNGTSGPGKGGAFVYVGTYDDLTMVPADSTFKIDAAPSYAITTGSNKGWYLYTPQTNLVTPIPGRVLVIKTATGRYAKVEITNYYKGGTTPPASASDAIKTFSQRYYTFRFTYQADGTTTFK